MRRFVWAVVAVACVVEPAFAQSPWIAEARIGGAWLDGSSDTTTGGAFRNGVVHDVDFGAGYSAGVFVGRRMSPHWSAGISFDHVAADASWSTTFPPTAMFFETTTGFTADASSEVLMLDVRREFPLGSDRLSLVAEAGAGVALNKLENVEERFPLQFGNVFSNPKDGYSTELAAKASLALACKLTDKIDLQVGGSYMRLGEFATGRSRTLLPGLGQEVIGPYRLKAQGFGAQAGLSVHF